MSIKTAIGKLKSFWQSQGDKILLFLALILVSGISFEAGLIKGQKLQQKPIIVEKVVQSQAVPGNMAPEAPKTPQEGEKAPQAGVRTNTRCAFVGSKNSDKYHAPTCQWAKRIKPENMVCFKSEEEAVSKKYQPDKSCIK